MDDLVHRLLQANVLTSRLIQEVFIAAKKSEPSTNDSESWDKISQIIWLHLQSGALKIDDQLLCATCFYTVISQIEKEEFYVNEVVQMIQNELDLRKNDVLINSKTTFVVSLMYGIFQSSFLITTSKKDNACIKTLLELTINLLIQLAYDYSRNTLTVFKIISTMKKVCGTPLQNCIFTASNQAKLLNLVNHNWENPITGVRDCNKIIFQILISLMDETNYQVLLKEINSFYWNKAKYLMLSEMIRLYNKNMADLVDESDWLTGLMNSLQKPGLVSAGTDMYCAILNKLNTEDHWTEMFLPSMEKIFNSESTKAIENFINYWCLATFKKFPALIKMFENIFEKTSDINKKMYNSLHVLKQGNRLGIVDRNWNSPEDYKLLESMVLQGIEHGNEYVRMAAFDIVCEFHGKTMPSDIEYELVFNYIKNNINSDCTVLRLGMLNSLKNFLLQIHNALIINSKNGQVESKNLRSFLKALQELVIFNLNIRGNYQRKITSVKLCNIIWECSVVNAPKNKKSDVSRFIVWDSQMPQIQITFFKMLIENEQWLLSDDVFVRKLIGFLQDPSDDIRENIVNLLTNYYSSFFKQSELIHHVLEDALKSIGGKFFYEISCGQSMFKLIVNILLKERKTEENSGQSTFKTVEDVYTFAFNELIKEHNLKRDILESIQSGKQLHSFMDILLVVLEVCHRNKYKIILADKEILELLNCLEDISNHFALKECSSSSDFSKMSDMVQQIIDDSGFTSKEDEDVTKISGIHQMVLNCMWLNVKACCDLSSLVIRHCDRVTYIEKFLLIITRVLESSRHKGAIESAGAALGRAIQYLTSLPDETDISQIPHTLLKSKLKELIMEASKMASITRRGAGLSIMVHRIVSSDMKKGKPLFHYFINMILETCNSSEDLPADLTGDTDIDNEKDLPKAIYIHFLTRIVVDSSIASDVMYYSPQLAKLAFDNLTSSHWQIRNAALQLYGALVPKLLGQKKASGFGEESIATVACDELRLHSPKLWIYINEQLRNVGTFDKVLSHSVLIPILNMLANSAMRYNFSKDPTKNDSSDSTLLQSLIKLLDSPIFTVRRLCAKSIFNIFAFDVIFDAIIQHGFVSENFLHGVLVLIGHCLKHDGLNTLHYTQLSDVRQIVGKKLNEGHHSYLCKELYESIFVNIDTDPTIATVHDTLAELDSNVHAPGIFNWAHARIKNSIQNISWDEIPNIVKMLLSRNELEFCCEILHEKLEYRKEDIPVHSLQQISELLMAFEYKFNSSALWRILYEISQQIDLNSCADVILEGVKTYGNSYKLRFMLPLLAKILSSQLDENNLEYLSKVILSLCDPQTVNAEMRYIAALSNNELATAFSSLPDAIKIRTIMSAVILLQDEDEDVRNLSTIFYKNVTETSILQHPYFCMQKLLDSEFLRTVLREPTSGIQILSTDLITILSKSSDQNPSDNYNPFANDSKNIYIEVDIIQQFIQCLVKLG